MPHTAVAPPLSPFFLARREITAAKAREDATQLAPGVVDCWAENIQLAYDVDADAVADAPGVTVRVVEGLAGLDLAGGVGASESNVYADLIDGLVDVGYERDVTVIGFPYDFRRAPVPGDATAMMARLVATIENATAARLGGRAPLNFDQQYFFGRPSQCARRRVGGSPPAPRRFLVVSSSRRHARASPLSRGKHVRSHLASCEHVAARARPH